MIKAISSLLTTNIADEYREEFVKAIAKRNIRRIRFMTYVILFFEILFLAVSFIPSNVELYGEYLFTYRMLYIFIIGYIFVYKLIVRIFVKQYLGNVKFAEWIDQISAIIFISWSAYVSLIDQLRNLQGYVYIFIAMTVGIIIILRPSRSIWMYITPHFVYILCNFLFGLPNEVIFSNIINVTAIIVTSFLSSAILFQSFSRDYMKQVIIAKQKDELEQIVLRDPLTELANRRGLEEYLHTLGNKDKREVSRISVIMLDVDYFKGFNDTYGHINGDEALIAIAKVIKDTLKPYDTIACRYGGDEFCIVLTNAEDIEGICQTLQEGVSALNIENKVDYRHNILAITTGCYSSEYHDFVDLWKYIDQADQALYTRKRER